MRASLIIPFKNEREYAELTMGTVHGFLSERGQDFELVAVDDSDDGTWEILYSHESGTFEPEVADPATEQ